MESEGIHFLDLGQDILIQDIIPLLQVHDIKSLSKTCKALHSYTQDTSVWAQLYKKTFGSNPTPFNLVSYKWPELYKLRATSKLFTWGQGAAGRLGYPMSEAPRSHITRAFFQTAISTPTEVKSFSSGVVLADVGAGGFSFQILTSNGNLYSTGGYAFEVTDNNGNLYASGATWHSSGRAVGSPGPDVPDSMPSIGPAGSFNVNSHNARSNRRLINPAIPSGLVGVLPIPFSSNRANRTDSLGPTHPETVNDSAANVLTTDSSSIGKSDTSADPKTLERRRIETKVGFLHEMKIPTDAKLISVSSGRCHFIALDELGNLWSWDHGDQIHGIKLNFKNLATNENYVDINKGRIITKAVAGWNSSCVYVLNVGIVVWKQRDALPPGVPSDSPVAAHCHVIKNTADLSGPNKVVDFFAGSDFICYLTASGKLFRVDVDDTEFISQQDPYEITTFIDFITNETNSLSTSKSKFVKLSGSHVHFAVFTDDDNVLIGSKENTSKQNMQPPIFIKELQKKEIISVAVGDYHFLALSRDGSVFSWGRESEKCGCLGLGGADKVIEKGGAIAGSGLYLAKPTKMENIGKAVAIAAAGWHSSAIIADV